MSDSMHRAIDFCLKYLPEQGPLEYFVHHNTLHAFEDYNFFDALLYSGFLYEAKTHKSIHWFQRRFKKGRITQGQLDLAIESNVKPGEIQLGGTQVSQKDLVSKLLHIDEKSYDYNFTQSELKIVEYIGNWSHSVPKKFLRCSDYVHYVNNKYSKKIHIFDEVELFAAKFFSAYFDKGISYWRLENCESGILNSFFQLHQNDIKFGWRKSLIGLLNENSNLKNNPTQIIKKVMIELGLREDIYSNYLFHITYRFKGWAALTISLENNEKYNPTNISSKFEEFAAICALLDLALYRHLKGKYNLEGFEYDVVSYHNSSEKKVIERFLYLLKGMGVPISNKEFRKEINDFYKEVNFFKLVQIWQEAYENQLVYSGMKQIETVPAAEDSKYISFQVVVCIDDREESLRRYFEEIDSECETFGYAGHYGLNIMFKGIHDVHYRPLCPVSATPTHYVWEEKDPNKKIGALGKLYFYFFHHSKIGFFAPIASLTLGFLSLIPMFLDVFSPYHALKTKKLFKDLFVGKEKMPEINFESSNERKERGYTTEEMGEVVMGMLTVIGLTKNFAPIVYIVGHGSASLNNPHEAAHDCGACSGGRGIPNARIFCKMANRKEIRDIIRSKGIDIPENTRFIAGYHNTCNDDLNIYDLESEYKNQEPFLSFKEVIDTVQKLDAKERVRKFENVSLNITEDSALKNVQGRGATLSQPRPEYGHATNAICVLGPRNLSKGIFWDRRAFLVSYNQSMDPKNTSLDALVNSIIPVCAGINLEYYFSFVDREVFGSGVKQPHNITGLMGVANGYRSDLRLGLPWQMVEIHEPTRIIIYIYSSINKIKEAYQKSIPAKKLIENEWVQIILVDKNRYYQFKNMEFKEIFCDKHSAITWVDSSKSYTHNKREILDFALIKGEV